MMEEGRCFYFLAVCDYPWLCIMHALSLHLKLFKTSEHRIVCVSNIHSCESEMHAATNKVRKCYLLEENAVWWGFLLCLNI